MEHKMQVHKQVQEFNPERGSVITIGTFDGVHLGHRTILKKVVNEARVRDLNAASQNGGAKANRFKTTQYLR
jgi:FAD synthase